MSPPDRDRRYRSGVVAASAAAVLLVLLAFSPASVARAATITVTNAIDAQQPGDGCSLREAILNANNDDQSGSSECAAGSGTDAIAFNLVDGVHGVVGAGPYIIPVQPAGLPVISSPVTIDGYTQPGSQPNAQLAGTYATILILLEGTGTNAEVSGLTVEAAGTTVRGLNIFRFQRSGILVNTAGAGSTIAGNFLYTNERHGVEVQGAPSVTIGGENPADRNVASNNRRIGVATGGASATGIRILGNYIGVSPIGEGQSVSNWQGGVTIGTPNATLGGTTPGARNVIADNGREPSASFYDGVSITASNATVQGNYIGVTASGAPLGNAHYGVFVTAANATIGGDVAGAGNVISANSTGIHVATAPATGTIIRGNYVGTSVSGGGTAWGNSRGGIVVVVSGATIGGATAAARNVVGNNGEDGIDVTGGTTVEGNFVGLAADGITALPNGRHGIRVAGSSSRVGGSGPGEGNTIVNNGRHGIFVSGAASRRNVLRGNSIFGNQQRGISLGPDDPLPNDDRDRDEGTNQLQNYPVLSLAVAVSGRTEVTGTLNSIERKEYAIDFYASPTCDTLGYGEGKVHLGSTTATSGSTFSVTNLPATGPGQAITATATDPDGNTSEFSRCTFAVDTMNHPPVGVGEAYATVARRLLTIPAPGVLSNDSDPDFGHTLTAQLVTNAAHGTVTLSPNGGFTYRPHDNYAGPDAFVYRATDGNATSGDVTVTFTVNNAAPVAVDDAYAVDAGVTYSSSPAVLGNDSDQDGHELFAVVVTQPAHGTLQISSNGFFNYTPHAGFVGVDSFTYRASDGVAQSNVATVTITVRPTVCIPRPRVQATPSAQSGQLRVRVEATRNTNEVSNVLRQIRFGAFQNARVTINGQEIASGETYTVPAGVSSVDFIVSRVTPGQATMVQLTVVDACGEWRTFVGGGPAAGF